jgi:hypothetical protein
MSDHDTTTDDDSTDAGPLERAADALRGHPAVDTSEVLGDGSVFLRFKSGRLLGSATANEVRAIAREYDLQEVGSGSSPSNDYLHLVQELDGRTVQVGETTGTLDGPTRHGTYQVETELGGVLQHITVTEDWARDHLVTGDGGIETCDVCGVILPDRYQGTGKCPALDCPGPEGDGDD